jgi:DNA invertase Pin-like site-specific DNA recombinase
MAYQTAVQYVLAIAVNRLLSTLLAAIAEFERDLIRQRTGEGRKRALALSRSTQPRKTAASRMTAA